MAEKKRVFISYKRNVEPDESVALEIFSQLSKDHDVFIDLKMMVGTKWSKEIKKNLLESDFFISLISANSINSDMITAEIQIAYKNYKTNGTPEILPVRLNYFGDLEYDLTAYLDARNYLSWRSYSDTPGIIMQLQQAINADKLSDKKVRDLIEQRAKDKESLIRKLLCGGDFRKARAECEKILEQNNEAYVIHLLLAIAILIGEESGLYPTSLIRRIEKHLETACKDENVKATAYIIWGIIKHDHYFLNGLPQGSPSLDDITSIIEQTSPAIVDISLLELVSVDRITYKALGLQRFLKANQ